jgi:hypothetical protein
MFGRYPRTHAAVNQLTRLFFTLYLQLSKIHVWRAARISRGVGPRGRAQNRCAWVTPRRGIHTHTGPSARTALRHTRRCQKAKAAADQRFGRWQTSPAPHATPRAKTTKPRPPFGGPGLLRALWGVYRVEPPTPQGGQGRQGSCRRASHGSPTDTRPRRSATVCRTNDMGKSYPRARRRVNHRPEIFWQRARARRSAIDTRGPRVRAQSPYSPKKATISSEARMS